MVLWIWTTWNAAATAVNAAFYASEGDPLSLGAATFCGLAFVVSAGLLIAQARR